MAKGITKKKNRRLKRQIRKTVGALLMVSAIAIAAVPVQNVEALPSTSSSSKIQVLNYQSKDMTSWETLQNDTGADLSSIESSCQSQVPYVDPDATIYTTGDGMFQFAFVKPSANAADEVAVILGANVTSLPGNHLTIPGSVDAYKKYTANTTNSGYCAVSRKGEYLYYKKSIQKVDESGFFLYRVPGLKGTEDVGEITTFDTHMVRTTQNEDGTWNYVYRVVVGQDDEGIDITKDYEAVPVMVDSCVPCYYTNRNEWIELEDSALYYWTGAGAVNAYDTDNFSQSITVDNQRIHDAEVQYIGRQYLVPNELIGSDQTGRSQSEWKIGGIVTETNSDKGVFAGKGQIVNLTVGDNLLGIGDYAFYGCSGLSSVTLGNGLSTLGNGVFADCVNMTQCNMQLNSQIAAIGKRAFSNCRGLTGIVIPVNVRAIGDYCFEGCDRLQSIDLCGNGSNVMLKAIGYKAFANCSSLTSLTFPDNYVDFEYEGTDRTVTGIPITYLEGCTSLQYVKVQNTQFTFLESNHTDSLNCDIGNFLKRVPEIFYFEGPETSAIHTTAKKHSAAFKYLNEDKFEKVIWCPETEYDDDGNMIVDTGHECTFIVDSNNRLIDMEIDISCGIVEIPANIGAYGIETIGSNSFQNNCFLKKIIIPSTVKYIEDNAFKGCHNLKDVIFSDPINIVSIGSGAFRTQDVALHKNGCGKQISNVPELTFTGSISPDCVPFQFAMDPGNTINSGSQPKTYITFYSGWPTNLTVRYNQDTDKNELLDYPKYEELSSYVAWDKNSAPADGEITYPDMTAEYASAAQAAKQAYDSYISSNMDPAKRPTQNQMDIVNSALNINLPAGIESIKKGIFSNPIANAKGEPILDADDNMQYNYVNKDIESVTMNTVEEIEPYTFAGCERLTGLYMSGGNTVGKYAFKDCISLRNVNIAPSVSEMGIRPFAGCSTLENVSFGESPYFICDNAVIFGLEGGAKSSIVECLETRGVTTGSYSVGPDELAGITSIYNEAFMDCGGIGKVDLSTSSLKIIPERCFKKTADLNSVVLPDVVKSIEAEAFQDSGIRLLTIPGTQSYIAQDAFMTGDWVEKPLDRETNPGTEASKAQQTIIFECIEGTTADRYAKEYWYINPEYGKVYLEHTAYFWDFPNYPDTSKKALFYKVKVKDGEDAVPPATNPSHSGYPFSRWTDYTNVTRDIDVYPIYGTNIYAVKFVDYDGTLIGEIQYVEEGKSAVPPADPVREGYTFDKWSQDWNNIKEDKTIVALYIDNSSDAKRHTVIFYDYDGKTILSQQSVNHGEAAVEPKSPTRKGYKFIGWIPADFSNVEKDMNIVANYEKNTSSGSSSGSGESSGSSESPSPSASSSATPTETKYTVSVSGGSGSGSYPAGAVVAINAYFLGEGQSFDKWTTSTAGVGFANPNASSTTFTMPAANVAITATYKTGSTSSGNTGSSTGSTSGGGGSYVTNGNSGSTVQVTKPGISNTGLAGATVSGATDNFIIKVTEDQSAADAAVAALQARYGDLSRIKYSPMDISLYDSTGRTKIADTSGISVNITLPLPDDLVQYAGNNKIAAVSNGSLEDLSARFTTVGGVPCINFTATHFSPYVIYVDMANMTAGTIDATPKTGDPIHPKWFLAIGMACISLILFFKRDKAVVRSNRA